MGPTHVQSGSDFSLDISERSIDFIGREWVFRRLNAWLDSPGPRVFLLAGDPGSGKTALATRLLLMSRGEAPAHDYSHLGPCRCPRKLRQRTQGISAKARRETMAPLYTVLGPIEAGQIGGTMSHVHLTINILCWRQVPDSGVLRGLSERKITMQNLGVVRRNAMLF
jgi:hypothetical protein